MPKPPRPWIVTPHDPIEKLDDNLWILTGQIPGNARSQRRMAIVKLSDGRLLFYNAIPMDEQARAEIEAWGKPAILILPYNLHMIDGHAFAAKWQLRTYGPKGDAKVSQRVPGAGIFDDLPADPHARVLPIRGMRNGEPVLVTTSSDGKRTSLVFADAFMNIPAGGDPPLFARLAGMIGGPKMPWLIRAFFVKDKAATREHFRELAALPGLTRLVPSHGQILTNDAAGALGRVANSL